ncbi:MAG: endopeptidase La [Planctomycetota bacterium]|jgi:ATP-dependent Lon protease
MSQDDVQNDDERGHEPAEDPEGEAAEANAVVVAAEEQAQEVGEDQLPGTLPVLPLPGTVAFPAMMLPFHVSEETHVQMIEKAVLGDKLFLAVAVRDEAEEGQTPGPGDLYQVGTTCIILQMLRTPEGAVRFLAQGLARSRIEHYSRTEPHLEADVTHLSEEAVEDVESTALFRNLREQFASMVDALPNVDDVVKMALANVEEPGPLCDLIAWRLGNISIEEKQDVLETLNVKERLQKVTRLLAREMEFMEVAQRIQSEARSEIDKTQREYYLRQQLKAIQDELGETDPQTAEAQELREQIEKKDLPEEALKEAERELGRLQRINPASPEYSVTRTYLDWIVALPWNESTPDNLDLDDARRILEEDHYGLEDVKERVLEFLAVRRLRGDMKGSILCFVGPPGTGKTSIGKSIARAMGRKYIRVSLGGTRDEAEIRGHRRTYIGSLPGRIISAIRKAGSSNPVFILDEVDKLGADFRGDPASALLEVLDPEQNFSYTDHYLEVPFDLSKVLFICTANFLDPVPPALKDRMETLEFPGYTEEEKLQIARRYLVPQQVEANGLTEDQISLGDEAIRKLIAEYTREAGVRNLERQIASLCRKVAKKIAIDEKAAPAIGEAEVVELLGPPKFIGETAERLDEPGIAAGLAWTPSGGDIIFVETTMTPGDGKLTLTGMLGDVMKESAQAALTHVRAHAEGFGADPQIFSENDFHIHVPAGAIPKDGPSAGVTIAIALASLCSRRKVKHTVAMTGEITLRGKVLPVGGIKEKILAARRAGIKTVVLPQRNENDLADLPDYAKESLQFVTVEKVEEILPVALEADPVEAGRPAGA